MDGSNFIKRLQPVLAAMAVTIGALGPAHASERIQFPEDELASESVLPVFDNPVSVKNRSVTTAGRAELGLAGGYSLMEPFYNPLSYGLSASYNFTEEHGVTLLGFSFMQGLSDNGKGLNPIPHSGPPPINANLQYAPAPKYLMLADYQFTGFYGKISITKEFVMNLSLYGFAGGGMYGIGDASNPVVNFGLGQKFYFTQNFALRFDLHFLVYQGPDVISKDLSQAKGEVSASEFEKRTYFTSFLNFGAVYLF